MQNLEYSKYTNSDNNNIIDEDNTIIEGIANFCAINRINNNSKLADTLNENQAYAEKCKNDQNKAAGKARDTNNRNQVTSFNTNTTGIISTTDDQSTTTTDDASGGINDRDVNGKLKNTENKNSGAKPRYNNMKNVYDQTYTTTINLGIGIIAAIFFITKHR